MVYFFYHEKKTKTRSLACSYYDDILEKLKNEFPQSEKAQERSLWFVYTVIASIIVPFSSSKTSNIIRCLKTLFGFDWIKRKKYILHLHGVSKDAMEKNCGGHFGQRSLTL